jgi:hypothetical protein
MLFTARAVSVLFAASAVSATATALCMCASVHCTESVLGHCPDDDWSPGRPVPPAPCAPARRPPMLDLSGARVGAKRDASLHAASTRAKAGAMHPPLAVRSCRCCWCSPATSGSTEGGSARVRLARAGSCE